MRRRDREITDPAETVFILDHCTALHLALTDGREPYAVPVNFGYTLTDGALRLFFHSARERRKVDMLRAAPRAAFSLECACAPVSGGENSCAYSYLEHPRRGHGAVSGGSMNAVMRRQPGREFVFTEQMLAGVALCEITVTEYSVKAHK